MTHTHQADELQQLQAALRDQEARNVEYTRQQMADEHRQAMDALKQQHTTTVARLQEELDNLRTTGMIFVMWCGVGAVLMSRRERAAGSTARRPKARAAGAITSMPHMT